MIDQRDAALQPRMSVDAAALLLRLVAGLIFIPHGYSKVFGAGGAAAFAADMPGYHIPAFLGYLAAYSEFFGALLLIVGLLTRLDAFLLFCTMSVAAFVVQLPDVLNDIQPDTIRLFAAVRGIETPLALACITLAIAIIGPGRFSIDHLLRLETRFAALAGKKKAAAEAAAV